MDRTPLKEIHSNKYEELAENANQDSPVQYTARPSILKLFDPVYTTPTLASTSSKVVNTNVVSNESFTINAEEIPSNATTELDNTLTVTLETAEIDQDVLKEQSNALKDPDLTDNLISPLKNREQDCLNAAESNILEDSVISLTTALNNIHLINDETSFETDVSSKKSESDSLLLGIFSSPDASENVFQVSGEITCIKAKVVNKIPIEETFIIGEEVDKENLISQISSSPTSKNIKLSKFNLSTTSEKEGEINEFIEEDVAAEFETVLNKTHKIFEYADNYNLENSDISLSNLSTIDVKNTISISDNSTEATEALQIISSVKELKSNSSVVDFVPRENETTSENDIHEQVVQKEKVFEGQEFSISAPSNNILNSVGSSFSENFTTHTGEIIDKNLNNQFEEKTADIEVKYTSLSFNIEEKLETEDTEEKTTNESFESPILHNVIEELISPELIPSNSFTSTDLNFTNSSKETVSLEIIDKNPNNQFEEKTADIEVEYNSLSFNIEKKLETEDTEEKTKNESPAVHNVIEELISPELPSNSFTSTDLNLTNSSKETVSLETEKIEIDNSHLEISEHKVIENTSLSENLKSDKFDNNKSTPVVNINDIPPVENKSEEEATLKELCLTPKNLMSNNSEEYVEAKSPETSLSKLITSYSPNNLSRSPKPQVLSPEQRLEMSAMQEEVTELRLQVNAGQQVQAQLELKLRQKDEVVIKMQNEIQHQKAEIEQLKLKLEQSTIDADKIDHVKKLEDFITQLRSNYTKLSNEMVEKQRNELKIKTVVDDYEGVMAVLDKELDKLGKEHPTVKRHLANIELAFSDVHQKYERCKDIIEAFKTNEATLMEKLSNSEEYNLNLQQKYEALKSHAMAQIECANKEITSIKNNYDNESLKQTGQIKCLEIKLNSVQQLLDQKDRECSQLSALLNELTGPH